ncbi:MAG: methylenetetrahydrofolate reductase C-terminal domain-containing protein [Candidatus Alcyoniella australis]|nr:methylenetetrahydrofolate reductase C-terminal domain-containing protein [Candidatus Alcyoniella australis]
MIVAQRKSLERIEQMLEGCEQILVVGCGTCVAVCMAGGEKEVQLLAEQLRMRGKLGGLRRTIDEITLTRQCDHEYLDQLAPHVHNYDALLSMACGAGVQLLAEHFEGRLVLPALDTRFIGASDAEGQWSQRCSACCECILDLTGGICPHTLCPKGQLNGPCGGADHGRCEVDPENECAWALIYRRLELLGRLDQIRTIQPPKDHSATTRPGRQRHPAFDADGSED